MESVVNDVIYSFALVNAHVRGIIKTEVIFDCMKSEDSLLVVAGNHVPDNSCSWNNNESKLTQKTAFFVSAQVKFTASYTFFFLISVSPISQNYLRYAS